MLSDNALLEIFDLCRTDPYFKSGSFGDVWKWHLLVHVCRRWRQIISESPRRLDLKTLCTHETPVRKDLSIWPTLPIVVLCTYLGRSLSPEGEDNVIAALRQSDRVCSIRLDATHSELEKMFVVMQVPFPVLRCLEIYSKDENAPVLPDGFLGGSAPPVQALILCDIPFPTLPMLLLSTSNLNKLKLAGIPPTGYISPEVLVTCLAALTRLETLVITFQTTDTFDLLDPDQIFSPPRVVLPTLTSFTFYGAFAYLESLVAQIDSPQLDHVHIDLSNQLFDVPVPQLAKYLDRSMGHKVTLFKRVRILLFRFFFSFRLDGGLYTSSNITCEGLEPLVSTIAESFREFSTILFNVVHLELDVDYYTDPYQLEGGAGEADWLSFLCQFSAMQSLYVRQHLAQLVALTLEAFASESEMVSEMWPSLDLIHLEGQSASSIERFVTACQLSGRTVTVVNTRAEFYKRLESSVRK